MKNIFANLSLGLLAAALSGCIVVGVQHNPSPDEVVVPPLTTADSVAFSEIDAAAKLDFDNNRLAALKAIAARPTLSTTSQVHLINKTLQRLDFENSKVAVLQTLIKNPAFLNPAKQTILTNLNRLSFENNRTLILAALNERGELKD